MESLPLTVGQQGIWFLSQVDLRVALAYNITVGYRSSIPIDPVVLKHALPLVAVRHELLRARLATESDAPRFEIASSTATLPDFVAVETNASIERVMEAESLRAFELDDQRLFRLTVVVATPSGDSGLVGTFHHMAFDEPSVSLFFSELSEAYSALLAGQSWQPAPTSSIISAFEGEREFLESSTGRQRIDEIVARLSTLPESVTLPTWRAQDLTRAVYPATLKPWRVPPPLAATIKAVGRSARCSPAALYLAVFQLLVWTYSREARFGISIAVSNRAVYGCSRSIGYLTNLVVVPATIDLENSVVEHLSGTTELMLQALDDSEVPFSIVMRGIRRPGANVQGPFFQIGYNYVERASLGWCFGESRLAEVKPVVPLAKNQLKLDVLAQGDVIDCRFLFAADLFDRSTIERMVSHYQTLLEAVVVDPQAKLKDLPLLTEAERHQILVEWNDTEKAYPSDRCIHQLFEEQVAKSPEAVAVVFEDQQLTYAQLNAKANQLAHYLRQLGVKPDTLVAICVERSLEMVIGLLGILKAGGAYVPLDPDYPAERLAYMLQDTAAPVLLTQGRLKERLPAHQARTVCLDEDWEAIGKSESTNPLNHTHPLNLAYCIYTSGSTGKPKGVLIEHRQVARLLSATDAWYSFNSSDVWTVFHSFAFDFSVWELWGALTFGGRALVVSYEASRTAERFVELLESEGVTVLNQTPTAFRGLVNQISKRLPRLDLRYVIFGGEALSLGTLGPWFEQLGDVEPKLVNMYGITETTVHVTYRPVGLQDVSLGSCPIGKPIPDLSAYILGPAAELLPIGAAGEIHIAGAGLARGYLNRADLTAEKFIANPYGEPGSRMYRTGDLGRYLPDGNIEFLGRIDHQVKIRGFRIELGEIENALLAQEGVREAVVLAREDDPGNKRLVAYVVGKAEAQTPSLTVSELRSHLGRTLPEYMVPSGWVFLDALPLNPNGKIDRKALPAPETTREDLGTEYVAPRTPTEELLAQIWAEVLKVERVGIHDDFFALGGHSILATQIILRLRTRGFVDLPLRVFFDTPTVAGLAGHVDLDATNRRAEGSRVTAIRKQERVTSRLRR